MDALSESSRLRKCLNFPSPLPDTSGQQREWSGIRVSTTRSIIKNNNYSFNLTLHLLQPCCNSQ